MNPGNIKQIIDVKDWFEELLHNKDKAIVKCVSTVWMIYGDRKGNRGSTREIDSRIARLRRKIMVKNMYLGIINVKGLLQMS